MVNKFTGLREEELHLVNFVFKLIVDVLILSLSLIVILTPSSSAGGNGTLADIFDLQNCERLTEDECSNQYEFKLFVLCLSFSFLTVELLKNVELAWTTRKGVCNEKVVMYIEGTDRLPHTAFSLMLLNSKSAAYFLLRLLAGIINSFYFLLLPLEFMLMPHKVTGAQIVQYLCFTPSLLLSVSLYPLLFKLLQEAESFLEVFFALVSLQIFSNLSSNVLDVVFKRSVSSGKAIKPFTQVTNNTHTIEFSVSLMFSKLYFEGELEVIDDGRGDFHSSSFSFEQALRLVAEVTGQVKRGMKITIAGYYLPETASTSLTTAVVLLVRNLRDAHRRSGKQNTLVLEQGAIDLFAVQLHDLGDSTVIEVYQPQGHIITVQDDIDIERLSGGDPEGMLDDDEEEKEEKEEKDDPHNLL